MSYIVPVHRPTSVRHAIKLSFLQPDEEALVVAKANRLEIYTQTPEGLILLHSKSVYGYIVMLERLRPASSQTDHLFVGTDRYQYFTVSWDAAAKQLKTEQSYVDQADKVLRDSRENDRCHIDPTRRYMTLELYDGIVTVVPIKQPPRRKSTNSRRESATPAAPAIAGEIGTLGEPIQVRIEELTIRSTGFVQAAPHSKDKPRLALLWEDNQDNPQLKIRELSYIPGAAGDPPSVEMKTIAELRENLDLGVSHLIPVSEPYGGFLILGERSINYVPSDLSNIITQDLDEEATIWAAWERVDDKRWLLGDDYGRLFFLMIQVNESTGMVESWRLDHLGMASRASVLVYLDEGLAFVGSHTGDSQVVRIQENGVEVLQTFDNIAPIVDFTIMDLGRASEGGQVQEFSSGQARIVTASGAWQDGSIRSVRSGVGMEELGIVGELAHITDLWALDSTGNGNFQDTLVATFVNETRVFKFDAEAAVEELESWAGLELSETTLLTANVLGNKILQVHESGVRISDVESSMTTATWKPPEEGLKITATSANADHVLVVSGGSTLYVLDVAKDLNTLSSKNFPADSQIASVTIPSSPSSVCIISFWQTASVAVFGLNDLEQLSVQSLGETGTAVPRSVLVATVLSPSTSTLFVAMADGSIVTFTFDAQKNTLSGMNRILLGSEPVFFKLLPRDPQSGLYNVFASCEQPSLIYASEGRIIYSAVNSDKASRVCHFDSEAYPGSIAIATPEELKLAMIDTERTTQMQTLPMQETMRCVTYSPSQQIFGLGAIRRILESGAEGLLSSVKIADEITFKELDSYELNDRELVECVISTGSFDDDEGEASTFSDMFVVGTSLLEDDSNGDEVVKGRIIVFEVNKEKKLRKVTELGVKGACRSLAMCDGRLVAGLVKTVVIYALTPAAHGRRSLNLTKLATYRTSTNPLSLSITPSTKTSPAIIAVADLMKSLSILALTPPGATTSLGEWSLTEIARHYAVLWSAAVTALGDNEWAVADMEGNILVLRRDVDGAMEDDRKRLQVVSEGRLGEVVNAIVPISRPSGGGSNTADLTRQRTKSTTTTTNGTTVPSGQAVIPKAFLGTVEGGVYMLGSITPAYQDVLMKLQDAVAARTQAPGFMPWARFRAVKTQVREEDEPRRFVDGELLECVLGMEEGVLEECMRELGGVGVGLGGVEGVKGLVEGLRRLC